MIRQGTASWQLEYSVVPARASPDKVSNGETCLDSGEGSNSRAGATNQQIAEAKVPVSCHHHILLRPPLSLYTVPTKTPDVR